MNREDRELGEALYSLSQKGYWVSVRSLPGSEDNEIGDFMFAHPDSLDLWSMFPYVIVINLTHRANKYKMPLLEIVGMTSTKCAFAIAFAFKKKESADYYTWVMQMLRHLFKQRMPDVIITDREFDLIKALGEVFPKAKHMLCLPHVMTSIKVKAKITQSSAMQSEFYEECYALFESKSLSVYEECLQNMRVKWGMRGGLIAYLDATWLTDFKEALVRAWVDHYPHLGIRTANNCKCVNLSLKSTLNASTGGFHEVTKCIDDMIAEQIYRIKGSIESNRIRTFVSVLKLKVVAPLRSMVTHECFVLLLANYDLAKTLKDDEKCEDQYWKDAYGVPCVHDFQEVIAANGVISLEQIHPFWKEVSWRQVSLEEEDDQHAEVMNSSRLQLLELKDRIDANDWTDDESNASMENWEQTNMTEPPHINPKGQTTGRHSTRRYNNIFECARIETVTHGRGRGIDCGRGHKRGFEAASDWHGEVVPLRILIGQVDSFVPRFVVSVQDVQRDGHCGYRALAVLLGYGGHQYMRVRREIANELRLHRGYYEGLSMMWSLDILIKNVDIIDPAPCLDRQENWMEAHMIPMVAATLYKKVVVILSRSTSHTCLPIITTTANQGPPTEVIAMAWIDRQHWVPVWLRPGSPLPCTTPKWRHYHHLSVDGWEEPFKDRMLQYHNYWLCEKA